MRRPSALFGLPRGRIPSSSTLPATTPRVVPQVSTHNTVDGKPQPVEARLQHLDDLGRELFINHYAAAWAWSTTTPFQWSKQVASHLGGTRDPLIVSWPGLACSFRRWSMA